MKGGTEGGQRMKNRRRRLIEILFFLAVMALSFYTVFHGQDISLIWEEMQKLSALSICAAIVTALFFVSAEGIMIYYLLRALGGKSGLLRCISYSFIGFFYSGITPSATGFYINNPRCPMMKFYTIKLLLIMVSYNIPFHTFSIRFSSLENRKPTEVFK